MTIAKITINIGKIKDLVLFVTFKFDLLAHFTKNTYFCIVIELARHLEILLLSNDCVAVPDFGGFVAHYISARIDEADGMFLPPIRTIGFNPQLKLNDSLLVQSYVEANDISYPEALRRIEQEVNNIKQTITYEGSYQLDNIGVLTTNDEGVYCFEPCESGLLTPTLYGLSSFELSQIKSASVAQPKSIELLAEEKGIEEPEESISDQTPLIELVDTEDDGHAIHIKMSWIRNTVAIAAAIVLFFLMTTPVANSNMESQSMSSLKNDLINKLIPKDSNIAPATPVLTPKKDKVAEDALKTEERTDSTQHISMPEDNRYCIVLASQVRRDNAELFTKQMREKGFKDTNVYIYNNVVRVVYGHFKTESDAYAELHKHRFDADFEEAWVYKRKTEG